MSEPKRGGAGQNTLYTGPGIERALEASGREHIQVPGLETVGPWWLFLPFCHWDVHLGGLEGCWILRHPGGLGTDQFHWRGLLGTSVGLGGKASWVRLLE